MGPLAVWSDTLVTALWWPLLPQGLALIKSHHYRAGGTLPGTALWLQGGWQS